MSVEEREAEEVRDQQHKAQLAALEAECSELRATIAELRRQNDVNASDLEGYVAVAAKGMAERDSHPMPVSVTTPEAFYKIMAAAALKAIGPRALLGLTNMKEREPNITQEPRRPPGVNSKRARHRRLNRKRGR